MARKWDGPWHEGFKAGGFFGSQCPYPPGTREAHEWELGWAEGVLKRTGEANYRDEPPSSPWRALLSRLRLFRRPDD